MTRFLQSLLTLALLIAVLQIAISAFFFFKMNRLRDYDPGPGLRSGVAMRITWDHWPFQIGRSWHYDSTADKGRMTPFIGINGARSPQMITEDKEEYYMVGSQQRAVIWDKEEHPIAFLTEEEFTKAQIIAILSFLIELVLTVIIWRHLFQFARLVGKKEFFDPRNGSRLRIIGWLITAMGAFTFISPGISAWLFNLVTDLGPHLGLRMRENTGSLYWVIAGLLLLVIAEAFRKGNQLQTEQEFTI